MANPLVLDACVLLNLIASDRSSEIFLAQNRRILVGGRASEECFYLRSTDDPLERIPVNLSNLIDTTVLETVSIETDDETEMFINLAAELDDGEAEVLAIALVRGYAVATDDRKARRVLSSHCDDKVELLSTSELVYRWFQQCPMDNNEVCKSLENIRRKASYSPSVADPCSAWWNTILEGDAR